MDFKFGISSGLEITQDPFVIIVYKESNFIIYYNLKDVESWLIYGVCSHNGTCIDGAINPDLRPYHQRLDCPVRPEIQGKCQGCDLRGVYL